MTNFYLGRDKSNKPLHYDPDDLTTHAVVVGMTGSGKTGLCIDLLEEAALNNIPALMIDPKGDITNTLLHFPDLLPADFQPWVNPDEARRAGKTSEQAAADTAETWKNGLAEWDITAERIHALKNSAHFSIYTPGSDAGIPVSILASLKAPDLVFQGNEEIVREEISGTVTAILGLVGLEDIDPVQSREHILLANIFENAWSKNTDLDLSELILQTQNPPFEKLGVFDLNTFFPDKDRFKLAMQLNNILAAPTFQSWITGAPLDIPTLLYHEDGRPRHSVFYIAHLSESERMFFVTLLYAAVETWMRSQSGSTSLRALLYFDEIFGYMPPISNPPSKNLMLRMLKQGRAFGVGQILATQNPVDIDYKALSNAGTWFIGKLQTDNDKQRLLDGLEGAAAGNLDRAATDKLISSLEKREFLLHNVHAGNPQVFKTRWAMNYLAGPITRTQIPALNQLAGAEHVHDEDHAAPASSSAPVDTIQAVPVAAEEETKAPGSKTRPALPAGIHEYFLPNNLTMMEAFKTTGKPLPQNAISQGILYRPALVAQADIRFLDRKYDLDVEQIRAALVPDPDRRGVVRWEDYTGNIFDPNALDDAPAYEARFDVLEAPFNDAKIITKLRKDFVDWAYRKSTVKVHTNKTLKLSAGPDISEGQFRKDVSEQARKSRDAEIKKLEAAYKKKFKTLQTKLRKETRELEDDRSDHAQRRLEELSTHFENIFGGKSHGRRRVSSSIRKRRMTSKAKEDIEESVEEIEVITQDIELLQEDLDVEIDDIESKWAEIASDIDEVEVNPKKADILVDLFGIAWFPYHVVEIEGGDIIDLIGYQG